MKITLSIAEVAELLGMTKSELIERVRAQFDDGVFADDEDEDEGKDLSPVEQWLFKKLAEGWSNMADWLSLGRNEYCEDDIGVRVRRTALRDLFCEETGLHVGHIPFSKTITKIYGKGGALHGGIRTFVFPPLDKARRRFEEYTGKTYDWENV